MRATLRFTVPRWSSWPAFSVAGMFSRLLALTLDAHDPLRLAQFWSGVLGREIVVDARDAFVSGDDTQLGLRFVPSGAEKMGPNRAHLHLTSASPADQQQTVATALELGARHIDVGQRPEEGHVVLADPEGNEFCVIEPGNAFLAGCGFLGELACDGTREVGIFWSEALGWPLVWDQDEETAIQSPQGGTKVAWGGRPWPRNGGGTGSASTSLRPTATRERRLTGWSPSVPRISRSARTASSSWPTRTATSSASRRADPHAT